MIHPLSFETKIGFDRIRQMISQECLCQLGRNYVEGLQMFYDAVEIEHELLLCNELKRILLFQENFPQDNYIDITPSLKKIQQIGSYMDTTELLQFRKSIATIKSLERYFSDEANQEKSPVLCKEFNRLKYFPLVGDRIDGILTKEGSIKDGASPELKHFRSLKKQKQVAVTRKIQSILQRAQKDGYVDTEAEITLREGRPVIPVAASYKRKLGGLIHDESASGKTFFIEPVEVVELNNELRELEYAKRREISKILTRLADDLRPYIDDLLEAYTILGRVDFIRAKSKLALKINAVKPILSQEKCMRWKDAVHPLLFLAHQKEGKEVEPLNIHMDNKEGRIVLISGPNAGGKSVCLKTVGLLQYMLQCGLLVPMLENSEVHLFQNIFIDIGDEQSLENDLSTYSSHLINMKQFVKSANSKTLVLIDEFGTGTEPTLGGAMAEAILGELNQAGVYGVITTHFANLKHFASDTQGIVNGAMLFDTQKIKPLFKLTIGEPGSSFAIEIARNIGLPESILEAATKKVGADYVNFEKHLREIIRDKKYWEDKRYRIRKVERRLDEMLLNYTTELDDLKKDKKKIIKAAKDEASALVNDANKSVERTIREIKESKAEKGQTKEARQKLEDYKKKLTTEPEAEDTIEQKIQELEKAGEKLVRHSPELKESSLKKKKPLIQKDEPIKIGDQVRMKGMDTIGEVMEESGKSLIVAFGSMRTTIKPGKLDRVGGIKSKLPRNKGGIKTNFPSRKLNFKSEIDIRGQRAEDALAIVQNFIDDALIVSARQLKILHGKGNGILRELIREYLKSTGLTKSVRDANPDQGGSGITLIELDI